MTDILDEVLSDEKDEKRLRMFRQLLPLVIGISIVIVVMIASYSFYSNKVSTHNQAVGDIFVTLISKQNGKNAPEDELEKAMTTSNNHQADLVAIKIIGNKVQNGDLNGALLMLETVISNKEYLEITTAFARILWVNLILDKDNFSENERSKIQEYLQYFKNNDQPFYPTALILKAIFHQKMSQNNLAKEAAESVLADSGASEIIKEQARAILSLLNTN